MFINTITKEEQEKELDKLKDKKKKPSFHEYILHDPKAFKIVFYIGIYGTAILSLIFFILSLILGGSIIFQILFGILTLIQGINVYRFTKNKKYITGSINDLAYKGKIDSKKYEKKKEEYLTPQPTPQGTPQNISRNISQGAPQ